jgi:hypothetical protein
MKKMVVRVRFKVPYVLGSIFECANYRKISDFVNYGPCKIEKQYINTWIN